MNRKKKKVVPFHIAHSYKEYELKDGTKFWARDTRSATLYKNNLKTK
jgi:hypothetical protein